MRNQLKNTNFYIVLAADLALFAAALVLAYLVRFEFILKAGHVEQILGLLPFFLAVKAGAFFAFGVYRGMFRYASVGDMWNIVNATIVASLILVAGMLFVTRFEGYSRAVFLIDGALTLLFAGGLRLSIRSLYKEFLENRGQGLRNSFFRFRDRSKKPVLIYGAGNAGEKILREILENPGVDMKVEGFLDDSKLKWGRTIHGIPVMGGLERLPAAKELLNIEEILIAAPSASGAQIKRIVDACKSAGLAFKTVPGLGELVEGKVGIKTLRDVRYADLLRREPVKLHSEKIAGYLSGKTVLVTGAGGSIGSELCRQIIRYKPAELVLLDASEPGLYSVQMELKHRDGYRQYSTVLGYIQDAGLMEKVMQRYRPHVVFHAAAYKHVPMLERNPWQAVLNNIRGNQVLLEKSVEYGVGHFVLVSTDKAVRPTNIMGASKRVCELQVQAWYGNDTRMMAVRFGNVIGSAGSVLPLFRRQIEDGGPVTVTHPEVTRYFMTIPEAAQLILQAGAQGKGGETFVLEMSTPIKILDMAKDLIRLSGKKPGEDIEIQFTGLRQGEKLYEELITQDEGVVRTRHEKIMVLKSNNGWTGFDSQVAFREELEKQLKELYVLAEAYDAEGIGWKMKEIVPEYEGQGWLKGEGWLNS